MKIFFIGHDFLFENETGKRLYRAFAQTVPIYDFHTHLPARLIADDHRWESVTALMLAADHYQWRALRTHGVGEEDITGSSSDRDKFLKWAETLPFTLRNPLYHWVHLELSRIFGIDELLNAENAGKIYDACNERLKDPGYSTKNLLRKMNVRVICTTDDPLDSLEHHEKIRKEVFETRVFPGFRMDRLFAVGDIASYNNYIDRLSDMTGENCDSFAGLLRAVGRRHDYFHGHGCRLADLGMERMEFVREASPQGARVFKKIRRKKAITGEEEIIFQSALLMEIAARNTQRGWTQLLHIGPMRNVNSRARGKYGPDTGFDSIGDLPLARFLADYLDSLDQRKTLPRTVIFTVNPKDNAAVAALTGCFPDSAVGGKIQFGAPWWFLDHRKGIEDHLDTLSYFSLLSHYIGMVSDSRSLLSFCRHEYFRRILCNLLGRDMEKGLLPDDERMIGAIVENICFYNAKNYFTMEID